MEVSISNYNGCERHDFLLNGHNATVAIPNKAIEGNPWLWKAEFFEAFPAVDLELLKRGWHLAYINASDMYGCDQSIEILNELYNFVTSEYKLSPLPAIAGLSRGGLYTCNYALKYPEHVGCIYLDAPVLDILSWPGGKYNGSVAIEQWNECLEIFGLNEETALSFKGSPIHNIDKLFNTFIPLIGVAGGADEVVLYEENLKILVDKYHKLGRDIPLYLKPNCGHHPHGLEDFRPIVEFIEDSILG